MDFNGQTQDYIDLSGDATVKPNLVSLNGSITAPGGQPTPAPATPAPSATAPAPSAPAPTAQAPAPGGGCGGDPAQLTTAQLAACVAELSRALQGRVQESGTARP
ncbi:hypothetical protein ACFQ1I_07030 [Kitasatospora arboriphila]